MARTTIKSHKKATDLNLTAELGDLLGLQTGSDSMKLKSADDLSEPDEKVEKNSVAAVEATINYVNKLLNESDEELPEDPEDEVNDEDPSLDDVEDEDEDLGDDEDDDLDDDEDDDVEECDGPKKFFSEDDESMGDEEDGEDFDDDEDEEDDDEELGDMDDEDIDDDFEDGEDDLDDEDSEDDELDGEPTDDELDDGEDMDDVTEGYRGLFEDDESMGNDSDPEDMEDDSDSDGLSIDIPEDMDPNDVSVSVGGSEYVPDTSDDEDEDLGDLSDDELGDDGDDTDEPVQEGYYPFLEDYFKLGEDDDPDIDDADPEYDDSEFDDEEDSDEEEPDDEDLGDEEPEEEVTESAVMRALRRLIKEGERSDDSITADPSNSTGDAPIDSEGDIDDSEAEEKDLSGSEGEVTDSDIPIEKGTIQPEEAAELRWMARKLKSIMEGDDLDSHSDGDGKLSAEPLDDDASDMIGDINDNLSDDGELTDTGNGAVDDSESTLGTPDEADDDVEVEGDDVVSSNGKKYDTEEDEDAMLTDNYHMLMTAIREAYAKKKGKKKDKKVALKKVDKKAAKKKVEKKGKKKLSEGDTSSDLTSNPTPELNKGDQINVGPESSRTTVDKNPPLSENRMKTLEDTALGSFNAQEMTSVLRNLNNAFGTGKVAKEVRDSSVVSEVSVPKWSLPIAENASWDGLKASKLLIETAYKSESKVNTDLLKKTHLYWEGTGSKESDYKFPIASMVEGQAQIIPQAIDEATTLFASPSFISRFSESALKKIRNVLDFYNEKMGKKSPWKENKQINVTEAAKITMIDRTQYNPLAVLKRLSEQEKAKKLINLRG